MTIENMKAETLQLMFSYSLYGEVDDSDVNRDYKLAMPAALTAGIYDVAATCRPVVRTVHIDKSPIERPVSPPVDAAHSGAPVAYDIQALAKEQGQLPVLTIAPYGPILYDGRDVSGLLKTDGRHTLWLPPDFTGRLTVYYHAVPTRITAHTPDDFVPEIDEIAQSLVPLFAAARLYREDDVYLANIYQNLYETQKSQLLQGSGGIGGAWGSESGWSE